MFTQTTQQQMPEPKPIQVFEPFTWKEIYQPSPTLNNNEIHDNNVFKLTTINMHQNKS